MKKFIITIISLSVTTLLITSCAPSVQTTGTNPSNNNAYDNYTAPTTYTPISAENVTTYKDTPSVGSLLLNGIAENSEELMSALVSAIQSLGEDCEDCEQGNCNPEGKGKGKGEGEGESEGDWEK